VVNPFGVATPTVGWKRAPPRQSLPLLKLYLISVLLILHFEIYMLSYIFMDCGIVNVSCEGIVCTTIVNME
jgi:hypothetical protein